MTLASGASTPGTVPLGQVVELLQSDQSGREEEVTERTPRLAEVTYLAGGELSGMEAAEWGTSEGEGECLQWSDGEHQGSMRSVKMSIQYKHSL